MAQSRITTATNAPSVNVKTEGAGVFGLNLVNRHSAVVYMKFYNSTVATFQDTPVYTIAVPATATVNIQASHGNIPIFTTGLGLCVRAVTDATDSGNTAPGTLPVIEVNFL
jgi:hypothetical protein